jgi:hypothetical protein
MARSSRGPMTDRLPFRVKTYRGLLVPRMVHPQSNGFRRHRLLLDGEQRCSKNGPESGFDPSGDSVFN